MALSITKINVCLPEKLIHPYLSEIQRVTAE